VDLEADPPLGEPGQRALIDALERAGAPVDGTPPAYGSAWRAAGLREAADVDEPEDYARSPRSTRGATLA
jgi:hypothetical protein